VAKLRGNCQGQSPAKNKKKRPKIKKPTKKKQTKAYGNARSVDYINAVFS